MKKIILLTVILLMVIVTPCWAELSISVGPNSMQESLITELFIVYPDTKTYHISHTYDFNQNNLALNIDYKFIKSVPFSWGIGTGIQQFSDYNNKTLYLLPIYFYCNQDFSETTYTIFKVGCLNLIDNNKSLSNATYGGIGLGQKINQNLRLELLYSLSKGASFSETTSLQSLPSELNPDDVNINQNVTLNRTLTTYSNLNLTVKYIF